MSLWGNNTDIAFPNLGIVLKNVPRGISLFGFNIAFYGVIIACGMLCGILMARWQARRTGQDPERYLDFALIAIPLSVIGARIYSVAFEWDYYKADLKQIFNLRNGGLAIYGGVITAVLTCFIYCRIKKINMGLMADTGILGMIIGQVIGRWGNFFNRECFGKYTDSLFAMRINVRDSALSSYFKPSVVSDSALASIYAGKESALANIMEIRNNIVTGADGLQYIQVQPTFLYESLWNLCLLIILIIYSPKKKFNGEILLWYLFGYGLGRFWIEGLRTDQLFLWNTGLAVSQLLSAALVLSAGLIILIVRIRLKNKKNQTISSENDTIAADADITGAAGMTASGTAAAANRAGAVSAAAAASGAAAPKVEYAKPASYVKGRPGTVVKPIGADKKAEAEAVSAEAALADGTSSTAPKEDFDIGSIKIEGDKEEE